MLYLKRKIDAFLAEWKANPDRKPLIVKGPRQVGKTESIKRFGDMNYQSVITINFVEEPKYKMITADGYKADDIIKNISRMDPSKRFIEGETLIFFDELQEFPDIATALKFFKIDGRFDVICSGSMLGINYRKSRATVWATSLIMRCSHWISRNSCGPKAMTMPSLKICWSICAISIPSTRCRCRYAVRSSSTTASWVECLLLFVNSS